MLSLQAIGQQAVMPDTQEAVGKHVLQEAVDEFLRREDIRLQAVAIAAIPISVADLPAFAAQDAVIADGHAMRVTSQVIQQLARPGERMISILPITRVRRLSSAIPTIRSTIREY